MSTYSDASLILPVAPEIKAGKIYSLKPTDGTGDFDFSRPTTATRVNENGLIETVSSNVPRIDYPMIDGEVSGCPSLLLEPQSTNLITYSEDFSDAIWLNIGSPTITSNYGISPSGEMNSTRVQFSSSNNALYTTKTHSANNEVSTIYVKGISGETIQFGRGANIAIGSLFTLNGDWQRIEFQSSSGAAFNIGTYLTATARDIEIWGAQLEEQSYPTSYIPTSGATATRVAETASKTGLQNYINSSEGVLYAEVKTSAPVTLPANSLILSINDNTNFNEVKFEFFTSNRLYASVRGADGDASTVQTITQTNYNKIAIKYTSSGSKLFVNGVGYAFEGKSISGLNAFSFSRANTTTSPFYGDVKDIRVYNQALTDSELQQLTS